MVRIPRDKVWEILMVLQQRCGMILYCFFVAQFSVHGSWGDDGGRPTSGDGE